MCDCKVKFVYCVLFNEIYLLCVFPVNIIDFILLPRILQKYVSCRRCKPGGDLVLVPETNMSHYQHQYQYLSQYCAFLQKKVTSSRQIEIHLVSIFKILFSL